MGRKEKTQSYKLSLQQLDDLHQEDAQAGGDSPPYNYPESRDTHHRKPPEWAEELQSEYGVHRRGPPARDW